MKIIYEKSRSNIKPELIDTSSSQTSVYLRKNITQISIYDDFTDNEVSMYEYDEAVLSKEEYAEYLNELAILDIRQQRADIDYIALMTGVDLGEVGINE